MSIIPFQRLISNTSTVFFGTDRDEAAINAANSTGNKPDSVSRFHAWPLLEKFDNDSSMEAFSPFGGVDNPDFIWELPISEGQTVSFAIASNEFTIPDGLTASFSAFLSAFADNALEARIELFEKIGGSFVKAAPQPSGLGNVLFVAGNPNNPAAGLTETQPYNWQDIRLYSTRFTVPSSKTLKIVASFEATNYLNKFPGIPNPAGLQFVIDIYAVVPDFLYVANFGDSTIEIYDITNPISPVRVDEFNGGNLSSPIGLAITGTTLYVANNGDDTVEIYDITNPISPMRLDEINAGNLNGPTGLAITGTTLYVANSGDDTVEIYDITNPTAPVLVDEFNAGNLDVPFGLAITGTTLYVANSGNSTVEIYDITDPTVPLRVDEFNGGNLSFPFALAITGTTLYVADQFDDTVEIYDITDPTAPLRVDEFNGGNLNAPRGLGIIGTTLYVANGSDNTVEIYDITDPTAPVHVDEFNGGNLNAPSGLAIFTPLV